MSYAQLWRTAAAAKARHRLLHRHLTSLVSAIHAFIDGLE
jgi:hypothetical protein